MVTTVKAALRFGCPSSQDLEQSLKISHDSSKLISKLGLGKRALAWKRKYTVPVTRGKYVQLRNTKIVKRSYNRDLCNVFNNTIARKFFVP